MDKDDNEKEAFVNEYTEFKNTKSDKEKEKNFDKKNEKSLQVEFAENYDLKLALSLSKTEAEAKKKAIKQHSGFARILPPEEAFQVIKDRLNLIYKE